MKIEFIVNNRRLFLTILLFVPSIIYGQIINQKQLIKTWSTCGYYETLLEKDTISFYSEYCDTLNADSYEWKFEENGKMEISAGSRRFDKLVTWSQYFRPGKWTLNQNVLTMISKDYNLKYIIYSLTEKQLIVVKE